MTPVSRCGNCHIDLAFIVTKSDLSCIITDSDLFIM